MRTMLSHILPGQAGGNSQPELSIERENRKKKPIQLVWTKGLNCVRGRRVYLKAASGWGECGGGSEHSLCPVCETRWRLSLPPRLQLSQLQLAAEVEDEDEECVYMFRYPRGSPEVSESASHPENAARIPHCSPTFVCVCVHVHSEVTARPLRGRVGVRGLSVIDMRSTLCLSHSVVLLCLLLRIFLVLPFNSPTPHCCSWTTNKSNTLHNNCDLLFDVLASFLVLYNAASMWILK